MPRAEAVAGVLSFLLFALLGFDEGGFAPPSWVWSAALLAAAAGALFTGRAATPTPLETGFLGALAGLLAWTLLSTAWSLDPAASVLESERLLLYVATVAALIVLARRSSRAAMLAGALCAVAALCLAGLADVLVGSDPVGAVSADPGSPLRLSEPVGYANAVAILAAMGVLLALGLASSDSRAAVRAACFALVPLLLATLYFTYGRGAWLALGLGLGVALVFGPNRRALALAALAAAPAALAAVFVAAAIDNQAALAALLALCAGAAALAGVWLPALLRSLDRRVGLAVAAIAVAAAVLVIVGAGGPFALARDAYRSFTTPTDAGSGGGRLLTLAGSSRVDYWRVAWHDVEDHPALGSGAGSYRRFWLRHRPVPQPARDAHSLYLETLAELGPFGLVLLLAALGLPVAAAVTARDSITPAALGPYAVYVAHAGQDWDWELPAVTVAALVCAIALLLASRKQEEALAPPTRAVAGAAAVLLAAVALAAYPGNRELALAEAGSERAAKRAARLQPWSGEPWRLLGEARLERGDVDGARDAFLEGLERDDGEWELWLDLAFATEGRERERALRKAARLNPLEPDLQELAAAG
jgi:O-Antigen ligase